MKDVLTTLKNIRQNNMCAYIRHGGYGSWVSMTKMKLVSVEGKPKLIADNGDLNGMELTIIPEYNVATVKMPDVKVLTQSKLIKEIDLDNADTLINFLDSLVKLSLEESQFQDIIAMLK